MFLQLQSSPFSNAQYELVVLHPEHFLPKGSSLTFYSCVNNKLLGKITLLGMIARCASRLEPQILPVFRPFLSMSIVLRCP